MQVQTAKNIIDEYAAGLAEILGDSLKQVILYGSYARGDQDTDDEFSDVDIMVLVDLDEEEIKDIEQEVFDYSYEFDLKYDMVFSPVIENAETFQKRLGFIPFYKNVRAEGVVLNG